MLDVLIKEVDLETGGIEFADTGIMNKSCCIVKWGVVFCVTATAVLTGWNGSCHFYTQTFGVHEYQ